MRVKRPRAAVAIVGAATLVSCASGSSDADSSSDSASSADDEVVSPREDASWSWTGLLIQEDDGVARACFGEIETSDPPGCPTGMPIVGLDLEDTSWVEFYEADSRSVAFANIVGRPTVDGFVLDGPISEANGALEALECESIDTGEAGSDTLNPQPAFELLQSRSSQEAGVWFSHGGTRGSGGIDATVLIFDEQTRRWFGAQTVFDGFELTVCPQLRPT